MSEESERNKFNKTYRKVLLAVSILEPVELLPLNLPELVDDGKEPST